MCFAIEPFYIGFALLMLEAIVVGLIIWWIDK